MPKTETSTITQNEGGPAYPLERPDDDPRFTFGLSYEVAQLLVSKGYPSLNGDDLVRLQQALFVFIYKPGNVFGS